MKKILIFFYSFIASAEPGILSQVKYGGSANDVIYDVVTFPNDGFIVGGVSNSNIS